MLVVGNEFAMAPAGEMAAQRAAGETQHHHAAPRSPADLVRMPPAGRVGQAEMAAQGGGFVLLAENTAALQLGHDQVDEVAQAARLDGRHDGEAVGGLAAPPILHLVGDLCRAALEHGPAQGGQRAFVGLADAEAVAPGHVDDVAAQAAAAQRLRREIGRQRAVERQAL